ncbi:MAG: hypothetical protein AAGU23_00815 [Bacillota bacterium]|nr:hypothetical protein [Negativicutes bacterium]
MLRSFIKDVVSHHITSEDIEKVREHLLPIYLAAKLGMTHEELVEMFSRAYDPIKWALGQNRMQARMLLGIIVVADNYETEEGLSEVGRQVVKAMLDSCVGDEVKDYVKQTLVIFQADLA